jgi:hypothetical protein
MFLFFCFFEQKGIRAMRRLAVFSAVVCSVAFWAGAAQALLVNVDFGTDNTSDYGDSSSTVQKGPAIVGAKDDVWNGTTAKSGNDIKLKDAAGKASPVTMDFNGGHMYSIGTSFDGTAYEALMHDYLIGNGDKSDDLVTLKGIPAGKYDLYLYSSADKTDRKAKFTVKTKDGNASVEIGPNADNVGTFTKGITYGVVQVTVGDDGKLSIDAEKVGGSELNLNGFQLKSVENASK